MRVLKINTFLLSLISLMLVFSTCKKNDKSINVFTVSKDIELGQQVVAEIESKPSEYPVLDELTHPEAYQHLRRVRDKILQSDELNYADRFEWDVYIIEDDETLNAFAAPGGYMYFYTGLIKFLDTEAQFAGVMAHEMAHADRRHSTDRLTKTYGLSIMISVALGNDPGKLAEIATGIAQGLSTLAFSRENEYEADEYAVKYLYDTDYHPKGISGFFEKLETAHSTPQFLSTHPSPDNRLEAIDEVWTNLGAQTGEEHTSSYQEFKNSLP